MSPESFRQIRRIFEAALERPPVARQQYLAEVFASDPELAAEVDRLLLAHGEPTCFPPLGPAAPETQTAPEPRLEGRRLGPYEILRQIGSGGMGVVYLAARADHAFRRKVAIKVIRPDAASPELVARFEREREILASLDHPNIAISARLALFEQVCSAVHHAHHRQVVHRDLKPSNILVTTTGQVKLLDFGIARSEELPRTLTQAGMCAMTPEYASPEQIRGLGVGAASDVSRSASCSMNCSRAGLRCACVPASSTKSPASSAKNIPARPVTLSPTRPKPAARTVSRSRPWPACAKARWSNCSRASKATSITSSLRRSKRIPTGAIFPPGKCSRISSTSVVESR